MGGVYPDGFLASYGVPEVFGYHGNQLRWYNDLTRYAVRQSARTTTELRAVLAQLPEQRRAARSGRPVRASAGSGRAARACDCSAPTSGWRCTSMTPRCPASRWCPRSRSSRIPTRRIASLWSPTFDPAKTTIVEEPVLAVGQGGRHRYRHHRGQWRRYAGRPGSYQRAVAPARQPHLSSVLDRRRSTECRCRWSAPTTPSWRCR